MTPHRNTTALDDWVGETHESIAARLEGAKASQAKIRLTLGTMAVISMMMLIAAYNAYWSYDYTWITDDDMKARAIGGERAPDILTNQALRDWAASRTVQISLLGIRVSVDDAAVLGSAVLFMLSLWLLLLARQEYHTVGSLLRHTDSPLHDGEGEPSVLRPAGSRPRMYSGGERWLIFHTIISNSLFFTFDHSLSRVHALDDPDPSKADATGGGKGRLTVVGLKFLRNFFFLFPAVAALVVFFLDRRSYRIPDPFDPDYGLPKVGDFYYRSMKVFFACWVPLAFCCWKSSRYSKNTEKVLRQYGDKLQTHLSLQNQPANLRREAPPPVEERRV